MRYVILADRPAELAKSAISEGKVNFLKNYGFKEMLHRVAGNGRFYKICLETCSLMSLDLNAYLYHPTMMSSSSYEVVTTRVKIGFGSQNKWFHKNYEFWPLFNLKYLTQILELLEDFDFFWEYLNIFLWFVWPKEHIGHTHRPNGNCFL